MEMTPTEVKWRGLDRKPHLGTCACVINSRGAAPEFCLSGSPSTTGASVLITPPRTMTGFHGRCWPRSAGAQRRLSLRSRRLVNNSRGDAPEFDGSGGELHVSPSFGHGACVNNSRGDAPEVSPCGSPVPGAPMLITPPRTTTGSHGSCPHHTTGFSREATGAQGQGENLRLSPTRTGHAHAGVSSQRRICRIRAFLPARRGPSSSSAR